jgi:hypothetical protein
VVNDRWQNNLRPYTPREVREKKSGLRPGIARLLDRMNPDGEAFARVAAVLAEMASAGVEVDEGAVMIAVKLAEHRQVRDGEAMATTRDLAQPQRLWGEQNGRESIVYYIRRGDLIKIGTTTNPKKRFESLVPDEILAWEPGGTIEEALRHRQFRRLKQGAGEYFRVEPDLAAHCKNLRRLHGDPDPAWVTTATVGRSAFRAPLPSELPLPGCVDLVTAAAAATRLGISYSTVRYWISCKRLAAVSSDERGRALFFLDHVRYVAQHSRISKGSDTPKGAT